MEDILSKLPGWVVQIPAYLGTLVIIATAIAQLTPSPKDDAIVSKVAKVIHQIIAWMPTLGKNPSTKKLEAQVKDVEKAPKA